ncbi:hotdog fold thioesterase [Sediminibacillus dalangtanensis]|uniref:Hotdog fold thioesterase n=1 Tax=Sediminibacillus dalangtanensis TaxID=2729421 RepID=A0ABX7VXD9_9BACI|nr:hotdog fold thioesterase [Sediminibacillus dalangtanensis]QTN00169.1 hotdog fold thioesterase [Sediminibacillus dalangtanensis]
MNLENTLMEALGMQVITQEKDLVEITMPVNKQTHQPMGFLHGGASVALAESAASIASFLNVDADKYQIFGIEINANHIKSKRSGIVTGRATPLHLGKTTMVWDIKIVDEQERLISVSRCTVGVVPLKN